MFYLQKIHINIKISLQKERISTESKHVLIFGATEIFMLITCRPLLQLTTNRHTMKHALTTFQIYPILNR